MWTSGTSSEFAADLHSHSIDVLQPLPPAPHGVEPYDPGVGDRVLIAGPEGILVSQCAGAPTLDDRPLDDDLTVEAEQVFESERPAVGVVRGGVERRVGCQAVGLEVEAGVPQHAAGIGG